MSELPKPENRLYSISDVRALEDCRTTHALMNDGDLATFATFDPTFVQAWLDDWAAELDAAEGFITDETYRDQIQQETTKVKDKMSEARSVYKSVKYFVQKAFDTDKAIQSEFGLDDYDKARRSDIRLHEFMLTLHSIATKYTTELTDPAVGFTAAQITNIKTVADSLQDTNLTQETKKNNQTTTTQERIQIHNKPWRRRQLVAEAAKIVYEDDYAKYQQYLLPASQGNPADFAITGLISNTDTNEAIADATILITELSIETLSDELGVYGFAENIPPGDYNLEISADGFATQTTSVTITSADETVVVNVLMSVA